MFFLLKWSPDIFALSGTMFCSHGLILLSSHWLGYVQSLSSGCPWIGILKPSIENSPSEVSSCETKSGIHDHFASGIYQMKLQSSPWHTLASSLAIANIFWFYQRNSSRLFLSAHNNYEGVIRETKNLFPGRMRHLTASTNIGSLLSLLSLLNLMF